MKESTSLDYLERLILQIAIRDLAPSEWDEIEDGLSQFPHLQDIFDKQLSDLKITIPASAFLRNRDAAPTLSLVEMDSNRLKQMDDLARRLFPGASSPEVLGKIGPFDLLEAIGAGAMGIVYKAFDRDLHRYVAIKILSPSLCLHESAKLRFIREAQAAASIDSPYVVPIHSVSVSNDIPYLVMNYVPSVDLQTHLQRQGPMSLRDSIAVAYQVAEALIAAHARSIIHRDIKPSNILIEPTTLRAVLTDFGLARISDEVGLTMSGATAGTPSFMSPEQAKGEKVETQSDWFSLGSVLYAMLTGQPPYQGAHSYAVVHSLIHASVPKASTIRPTLPPWVDRLLQQLMNHEVGERLVGVNACESLRETLLHIEHPDLHSLPEHLAPPIPRRSQLHWTSITIASTLFVVMAIAVFQFSLFQTIKSGSKDEHSSRSAQLSVKQDPKRNDAAQRADLSQAAELDDTGLLLFWDDEDEAKSSLQNIRNELKKIEQRIEKDQS